MKLATLEALKLELVGSSSMALHLTRNWQFVEITQSLFEKLMSPDNKDKNKDEHITIIGDLSFLSKEEGLEGLLRALADTDKKFDVYFH
jgi:flagellar motor component MotA